MIDYIAVDHFLKRSLAKVEKEVLVHDKKKGTYYRKQLVNVEDDKNNFNNILDPKDLVNHLESEYSPWIKSLSSDEYKILRKYTLDEHYLVNIYLRGLKSLAFNPDRIKEVKTNISIITSALNKSEVKTPLTVHRQIKGTTLIDQFKECMKLGSIWEDPAFMSTTVIKNSFKLMSYRKGVIHLVIDVPKGKGIGGFVKEFSEYPEEQEFLLNRGSRFKVTKITEKSPSEYVVNLKLVGRSSDNNE